MSLQLLVARKPFRTDKENFDDDSDRDDDLLQKPRDSGKMFATIAGEGEDVETEDEDLAGVVLDKPTVAFELADLQKMLARDAEIEEAGKPGRPKEAHKQMKAFPQIYHQICSERLQLPAAASHPSQSAHARRSVACKRSRKTPACGCYELARQGERHQ